MKPSDAVGMTAVGETPSQISDLTCLPSPALACPRALSAVLADLGIETPTPIQTATLPDALAGRDVLGRGRTGSGKTYAFLLPLVARLSGQRRSRPNAPRALILAPTRELVGQIEAALVPLAAAAGPHLPHRSSAASVRTHRSAPCVGASTSSWPAPAVSRT